MNLSIAISMRIVQSEYGELRDALAQDWSVFLQKILPNCTFVPIPNIGKSSLNMVNELGLNGLILTGGESWGEYPQRDNTEENLFHWAKENSFPILGICRGMQIISQFFGASLIPIAGHVATRHNVTFSDFSNSENFLSGQNIMVNSFHNYGITNLSPDNDLKTLAIGEDNSIEAINHATLPILGLMWHPEREKSPAKHDKELIQQLFGF